jgi:hypothetical protein
MSKIALFRMKSFQMLVVVALIVGGGIAFAVDTDNDGMSDAYEAFFKLNATNALDATEDPDADTLANLAESALWTNPNDADTDADGFNDNVDHNPLSRAVILWGNPDFTEGDTYAYTGPDWWLGAGKSGGTWVDGSCWELSAGEQGKLYIDIDRSLMKSDLVVSLFHQNVAACTVYLDLGESDGTVFAEDLYGDIADGDGSQDLGLYMLPLASYTNASRIIIDATAADESYIVWATTLYVDMDGDGLDADQETQVGTSDENADCDGDSLTDYEEVIIALSNPLAVDSDEDGLFDAQEVLAGSNPLEADSDGDGLSDSEELEPYYYLSDDPVTWAEAKTFAEASGGHLAVITSEDELNVIKAALPAVRRTRPWLGATDMEEDGVWQWITGETFDYTRWGEGEPNNYKEQEKYLRFAKSLYWADVGDETKAAVLIEYESGLDPLSVDTDGDGLSDVDEITLYKSNAHAFDSDGDGLSDGVEAAQGLNLNLVDSDQDGISDSDELDMGLNPLSADTDGDGLNDGDELSQRYQLIHSLTTWPDAKEFAEESGGYLAVLTSDDEMGEVATVSTNTRSAHPWIGATDAEEDGLWQWVNGETFDYTHWAANEPNNNNGSQVYLRLSTHYLRWDDEDAELKTAFLIEYDEGLDPFNPDTDGDGLTDGDEIHLYGSDARNSDSDRDGLSDSEEVLAGLDPINSDSDGDTLLDVDEIAAGLNPACADTDGDGLDDGAELLQRYKMVADLVTWPEAKELAEAQGGYLATVTSDQEFEQIQALVPGVGRVRPWLGAEELEEGVWSWVTGESFEYTNWAEGEPNNYNEPQMYLRFYRGLGWDDASPSTVTGTLIEYADGLDPLNPDSDGDGLCDGDEVLVYSSDARVADSDGDGINDGDEVAMGLNPILMDSDGDGLNDDVELSQGLDPVSADSDSDGLYEMTERDITLTDPLLSDSNTNGIADLTIVQEVQGADLLSCYEAHISATWSVTGTSARVASVYNEPWVSYEINVTDPSIYQLTIHADKEAYDGYYQNEIQINVDVDDCDAGQALRGVVDGSVQYTVFTPWLTAGTHTITVTLINDAGPKKVAFWVNSLELGVVDGVDSDGDGLDDWMESLLDAATDTDGDGITDLDEINLYGTSPTESDSDGDGLSDGEELELGTDPLDTDSDDDGVVDGVEVNETFTSPLYAEFDGTSETVSSLPGVLLCTNSTLSNWEPIGDEMRSTECRGYLEYAMDFPEQDLYCLNISAAHFWDNNTCSSTTPIDTSAFLIYVDGVFVGEYEFISADGVYEDVRAFLPVMPAGEHTVRIFWDNVYTGLAVQIRELQLQILGGPDRNENGTKDWIEVSLAAMAGVDAVTESYFSPACIEGNARYVPLMSLVSQAASLPCNQSAGARWYTNLPLAEEGCTTATAMFQNGALELPVGIEWVAYNLMDHNGEILYVRKGDSVKLSALPSGAKGGQFTISVSGITERSSNTHSLVFDFSEAGSYVVQGEYRKGKNTVSSSITVEVLDGSFPEENPACLIGKQRDWTFVGMSSNTVFEVDSTVELSVMPQTPNSSLQTVSLKASEANGEHRVVARAGEDGPILDTTRLDTCWVQNAADGYFWTVESFDDSELWEVVSIQRSLPDTVDLKIKVIVGGVTFDDYTLERWITSADYDDAGLYRFRLFHPNDAETSVCHTVMAYQNGLFIGEILVGAEE